MTAPIYAIFATNAKKAALALGEARFETWCPTYERLRRIGRKDELRPDPLFPGYVFARVEPHRFAEVRACEHVVGVVGVAGTPFPIPEGIFTDLLFLVMSGRLNEKMPSTKARPRGIRRRGLEALNEWFAIAGQSLKAAA